MCYMRNKFMKVIFRCALTLLASISVTHTVVILKGTGLEMLQIVLRSWLTIIWITPVNNVLATKTRPNLTVFLIHWSQIYTNFSVPSQCRVLNFEPNNIHKSVKHLRNSQQIKYATGHDNSYANRERNPSSIFKRKPAHRPAFVCR
jgi:hypothetical protein